MRRTKSVITKFLRGLLLSPLLALLLFEEWGWEPLGRRFKALAQLPLWAAVERHITNLPPWAAMLVFALPVLALVPIKLLALYLLGNGHLVLGFGLVIGAKIAGTAIAARLFQLTEPTLMRLGWFARLYTPWKIWKDGMLGQVRNLALWRQVRRLKTRGKAAATRGWQAMKARRSGRVDQGQGVIDRPNKLLPDTFFALRHTLGMNKTSLDKAQIKFLLLEGIHPSAVKVLRNAGYSNIENLAGALEGDQLKAKIADAHFVGIRSRTQLTADVFAHAHKLAAVGCFCIGTNQVDLNAAREKGIAVFNAPYSNTRSVAELVLAEAILLLRGVPEKSAVAHRGGWLKSADNSYEIRGKTLGIVGYGSIGTQLSVLAEGLGMHVVFFDVVTKLALGNARQIANLKVLLATSDVVTLHVPELDSTQWMIGESEIAAMKPGAVLINASRGTVVKIEPLAQALRDKKLLGAAIDVFPTEPKSNKDSFESPLRGLDNVILTPHVGGSTVEAQENIGIEVAEKLVKYSDNGTSTSSVNFPEVALPAHPGKHRLLHIHRNVPGVLSEINKVFGANNINIASQFLQTNGDVGYVVIDIDAAHSDIALEKLADVPGTIRSRVLF